MSISRIYRHISIVLIALTTMVAGGCNDDFDFSVSPSVEQRRLSLEGLKDGLANGEGFSTAITVNTYSTPWTFSALPTWITMTPNDGQQLTRVIMNGKPNNSGYESRSGQIVLSSTDPLWDFRRIYNIAQNTANQWVNISDSDCTLNYSGASFERMITVDSNCYWRIENNCNWLSVTHNGDLAAGAGGFISISCVANNTGGSRTAVLKVYTASGSLAKEIRVTQAAAELTLSSTRLKAVNAASRYQISVTSDIEWFAYSDVSWINITPTQGPAGTKNVDIEVAPNNSTNTRSGRVVFYCKDQNKRELILSGLDIVQDQAYIEISNGVSHTISSRGGDGTIQLRSNTNWVVSSLPAWISVSDMNGVGDFTLTYKAIENPTGSFRRGQIVISKPGISLSQSITVEQDCQKLTTSENSLWFDDRAASQQFGITSDAKWESKVVSGSWLSTDISSGDGNATITATVTENNSTSIRNGTINYTWPGSSLDFEVGQAPKYLSVSNETLNYGSTGGNHQFEINTNDRWTLTVEGNPTWLSVSATAGDGRGETVFTIEDNPSVNPRSARVILETENCGGAILIVNQRPRLLELSMASVYIYDKGGLSTPFTISTDGTYAIEASDSWFRPVQLEKNVYQLEVDRSADRKMRKGYLNISLTDLREGSLSLQMPVVQIPEGGTYILDEYSKEIGWDISTKQYFSKTAFGLEQNYTPSHSGGNANISQSDYGKDKDWTIGGGGTIGKNVFGNDQEWGSYKPNLSITVNKYTVDTYWGLDVTGTLKVTVKGFSTEKDWGRIDTNNSAITLLKYGVDECWAGAGGYAALIKILRYGDDKLYGNMTGFTNFTISGYNKDGLHGDNSASGNMDKTTFGDSREYGNIHGGGSFNRFPYGSDVNHGDKTGSSGTVDKWGFGNDKNQGKNPGSGTIDKWGYGNDKNHEKNSGSGNIGKNGYKNENSWD